MTQMVIISLIITHNWISSEFWITNLSVNFVGEFQNWLILNFYKKEVEFKGNG